MKRIALPAFPDGVIVYELPAMRSLGKCVFCVPAGFEAVRMRDGCLSGLCREGDRVFLNAKKGLLGINCKDRADSHLYVCKKQVGKPLKWGIGDIPYDEGKGGMPILYGANGTLRISVADLTKLMHHVMGGARRFDTRKIGQYLEAEIAAQIRIKLTEAVQKNGLASAALRLDQLAAAIKPGLAGVLDQMGIWPEAFTVDSVEPVTPYISGSGRDQG